MPVNRAFCSKRGSRNLKVSFRPVADIRRLSKNDGLSRRADCMSTQRKLRILVGIAILFCLGCSTTTKDSSSPYVTSTFPIRIVSANDGDANQRPGSERRDSVTVIDLSPDAPPQTRTVSGTVPNTFNGAPSSAIISEGRYAVIPNHSWGQSGESSHLPSQITVVDLDSKDLKTVATLSLPEHTWQVAAHPDGDKVIVISGHHLFLIEFASGIPRIVAKSEFFPLSFISFALSPKIKKTLILN